MTAATPTLNQIKAQVSSVLKKVPEARVIGLRSGDRWTGDPQQRTRGHRLVIHQCDSPLAMRLALHQSTESGTIKVLLTSLEEQELSQDIMLRMAKQRLFTINSWQIVCNMFQARTIDPRLSRTGHAWMADALLEAEPSAGYPAARGGFLDAELVWPILLQQMIGFPAESTDLTTLLKWSFDVPGTEQFRRASPQFQDAAISWLTEKTGPVAATILHCLKGLERPDVVPLGLAMGVLFHSQAMGKLEKAAGKLEERFLGGRTPEPSLMLRWNAAATEAVRALKHTDLKLHRQTIQRADAILQEIQAEKYAHLSDTSLLGFDQRLSLFGQRLAELLDGQSWDGLQSLLDAREAVRRHDKSTREEERRLECVEMALRLVRWLGERSHLSNLIPLSLAEAAEEHVRDGGYVDWARNCLRSGDAEQSLSAVYARLFDTVTQVREKQSQQFAKLLVDWTAAGSTGVDVVPVEQILDRVVAPLATNQPVLVIVIDGMSVAVCRELLADLTKHEWTSLCETGRGMNRPGLAMIPSVTEFSRTSLLCGQRRQGAAADEQARFAEHPTLLPTCRNDSPPILFHKVDLQESQDDGLAKEVRNAIQSSHRKIVGVVVNAVDDHLLKGDQIDVRWTRDNIKVLPALLHEAHQARRLVVLVSDHGHVLDTHAQSRQADGGERWRVALGTPAPDEFLIRGSRVLVNGQQLIAPWSERVRYAGKKNGYHGGLTPQEMVVPIVVLSSTNDLPPGWQEQPVDLPVWWDEPQRVIPAKVPPVAATKPNARSGLLFPLEQEEKTVPTPIAATVTAPAWVQQLLQSPVFAEQKRLASRGLPKDDVLVTFFTALDQRGGKMTTIALARALNYPAGRSFPSFIATLQRLLNVDGYAVLHRDEASDTIELNRELLRKQFDLP